MQFFALNIVLACVLFTTSTLIVSTHLVVYSFFHPFSCFDRPFCRQQKPRHLTETELYHAWHRAIKHNNFSACIYLLKYYGLSRLAPEPNTQLTLLHRAAYHGRTNMCLLLLNHRVPINAQDVHGHTAIAYTLIEPRRDHYNTRNLLIERGARLSFFYKASLAWKLPDTELHNQPLLRGFVQNSLNTQELTQAQRNRVLRYAACNDENCQRVQELLDTGASPLAGNPTTFDVVRNLAETTKSPEEQRLYCDILTLFSEKILIRIRSLKSSRDTFYFLDDDLLVYVLAQHASANFAHAFLPRIF